MLAQPLKRNGGKGDPRSLGRAGPPSLQPITLAASTPHPIHNCCWPYRALNNSMPVQERRLQQLNHARWGPELECINGEQVCPVVYDQYMEALLMDTAALEARHLRAPGTMQLYERTQREFSAWLAYAYGNAATGWACCNPADVLAYLPDVVPMLHSGRGAPGQPIMPSTLEKIVSALARCFELRERGSTWHARFGAILPGRI
jgi:hypothetical protein